ncbi:MAG: hypothetical protein ABSD98_17165 [Candidatus Korobacteraceae bacterium]|jgi:hypothetical protein
MIGISASANLPIMQLIQIGEIKQKTVLDMIQEMAERQFAEMEQLKAVAQNRSRTRRPRRTLRRCTSPNLAA